MWYMANPSTGRVREAMGDRSPHLLGVILSERQGNRRPAGTVYCVDNNCGPCSVGRPGDAYPGDSRYLRLLQRLMDDDEADPCDPETSRCLFAAAPDVLGDAAATLARSEPMLPLVRLAGMPAALVAQNGLERLEVPWGEFDCLFLGGSAECAPCGWVRPWAGRELARCPRCARRLTEWKLGAAARELAGEAAGRGKWVHMGRVNSLKRLRYAALIGCDSCDGTFLARAPDVNLARLLPWLAQVNSRRQPDALFEIAG
jgi:hypothetical protein